MLRVRIKHDHLDGLVADAVAFKRATDDTPGLWKADVDSAFRRVPLTTEHMWAAGVAYLFNGIVYVAIHKAMPFGATSAVVAWHRVGAFILAVARMLLHLPVKRYVDDYFAVERCALLVSARTPGHIAALFVSSQGGRLSNTPWGASPVSCACS